MTKPMLIAEESSDTTASGTCSICKQSFFVALPHSAPQAHYFRFDEHIRKMHSNETADQQIRGMKLESTDIED